MKTKRIFATGIVALLALSATSYAQQASLASDQNPRHEEARAKYMNMSDSLTATQGTTVQNTYKAYDWYEAREERRKLRRERSYQNSLYNYPYYQSGFYSPSISLGYGSGFGYGGFNSRYWGRNRFWYGGW